MKYINVDEDVYRALAHLAAVWHTTVAGALARLVTIALDPGATGPESGSPPWSALGGGHRPQAGTGVEATSAPDLHAVAELLHRGAAGETCWACPGCGTTFLSTDADMIVDHVKGCALVDGAGNPLPGGAA